MRIVIILLALSCAYPVSATDRVASTSGSGSTCSTVSPCSVTTALGQAVAGDNVILENGTYPGNYTINGNDGAVGNVITLKARNQHQAIISTGSACDASFEFTPMAFAVKQQNWVVQDFDITGFCVGVRIDVEGTNTEVRHNIIRNYRVGVQISAPGTNVHHNVIAFGFNASPIQDEWASILVSTNVNGGTIRSNWLYSNGNRRHIEPCCNQKGSSILMTGNDDNFTVQGNVMFDGTKNAGMRIFGWTASGCVTNPTPACPQSTGNTVRDNIVAYGQGDGYAITENAGSNLVTNNICFGAFLGCGHWKGNDPGGNIFSHNTSILTHWQGLNLTCGSEVNFVCARESDILNNIFYSPYVPGPSNSVPFYVESFADSTDSANFNLFWADHATATNYTTGYTLGANDIRAFASRPVFVNEAIGDYRLASGSPGENAASDGTDMGANFNDDLRVDWVKYLFTLPTQENTTSGGTSTSFTTTSGRFYQVWGYVDASSPHTGSETVTVEGVGQTFNLGTASGRVTTAPRRYIYLTTRVSDGTLNVSWTDSDSFDKIFIREMPTVTEAWAQLVAEAVSDNLAGAAGRRRGRVIQ